jgi:hypothetical protein
MAPRIVRPEQNIKNKLVEAKQAPVNTNVIVKKYKELARRASISRGTTESINWFRSRIRKDASNRSFEAVTKGFRPIDRPRIGSMVTYMYDPKWKKTLPYYDTQPLIILVERNRDGWYGVNMHYLPPKIRAELLLDIGWVQKRPLAQLAKGLERSDYLKHACKKYLTKQASSMVVIPKEEWEIVIQLPFEAFEKTTNEKIWRKARK